MDDRHVHVLHDQLVAPESKYHPSIFTSPFAKTLHNALGLFIFEEDFFMTTTAEQMYHTAIQNDQSIPMTFWRSERMPGQAKFHILSCMVLPDFWQAFDTGNLLVLSESSRNDGYFDVSFSLMVSNRGNVPMGKVYDL